MDHPNLTPHERKIVNENVGRLGAQLLRERVDPDRWANIVLAVTVELAGQVLRLVNDTERPPAPNSADAFHSHLEACERCAHRPFDLCEQGTLLLNGAAAEQ
jgi:hypothetical protein